MFTEKHGKLLGQRKFEMMRPKEVILPKLSLRLVCGCTYHVNMYYLLQALNKLLVNSGHAPYKTTGDLTESTLCEKESTSEFHQIDCIKRKCENCGVAQQIAKVEAGLKCSKTCQQPKCHTCVTTYNTYKYEIGRASCRERV